MIGILLITHGNLGQSLLDGAAHVLGGTPPCTAAMSILSGDKTEVRLAEARRIVKAIDDGAGVLVLTDIFGATPANIAGRLLDSQQVEGIAGVNLPMLVKALSSRDLPLEQLVGKALAAGAQGQIRIKEDCCHGAEART